MSQERGARSREWAKIKEGQFWLIDWVIGVFSCILVYGRVFVFCRVLACFGVFWRVLGCLGVPHAFHVGFALRLGFVWGSRFTLGKTPWHTRSMGVLRGSSRVVPRGAQGSPGEGGGGPFPLPQRFPKVLQYEDHQYEGQYEGLDRHHW